MKVDEHLFLGTNVTLGDISLDMLIPSHDKLEKYYRYQGSLTTPACSEAVVWTIFEEPIPLSREQVVYYMQPPYFAMWK